MALVITLLVVAILTAVVVEFAYGVYVSTNALHNWQTAQRLSLAAKSATRLGARLITENTALYPYTYPGHMEIAQKIPFGEIDGTMLLRIEDENSKFNLNSLIYQNRTLNTNAYDSFLRMLRALGLNKDIADRIADWIDPDTEPRLRDSENSVKNGYLDSIDELLLIPGIDRESYDKLLPYITIYGSGLININGAAVPVLMSLSDNMSMDNAEKVLRYRDATPFADVSDINKVQGFDKLGIPLAYITVKGTAFHLLTTAQTGNIKRVIESVIDISGSSRVVRYWKEY
jgi:general secretion pathway protein K